MYGAREAGNELYVCMAKLLVASLRGVDVIYPPPQPQLNDTTKLSPPPHFLNSTLLQVFSIPSNKKHYKFNMPLSNLLIAATAFIPGVVGIQLPRRVPKSPTQGPSNSDTSDSSDSPASSNRRRALSNGSGFKWSPMRLFAPGGSSSSLNLTPTPSPRGFEAAPQRLRDPLPGQWAGPEHYKGGKVGDFIRGEIARVYREEEDEGAYVHGLELVSDEECPSTATLQQFNKQVVNLGLTGLYGCTSVVIVTSWGAWMSHREFTSIVQILLHGLTDSQFGKFPLLQAQY
jgi:hypothetical protein